MPTLAHFPHCPTVTGYSYSPDAGLVRTEMTDGVVRQRRKWGTVRNVLNLRFVLTPQELAAADLFFETAGGDWFTCALVSGLGSFEGENPVTHKVRLIDNPTVRAVANAQRYEYLIKVETDPADWVVDSDDSDSS